MPSLPPSYLLGLLAIPGVLWLVDDSSTLCLHHRGVLPVVCVSLLRIGWAHPNGFLLAFPKILFPKKFSSKYLFLGMQLNS